MTTFSAQRPGTETGATPTWGAEGNRPVRRCAATLPARVGTNLESEVSKARADESGEGVVHARSNAKSKLGSASAIGGSATTFDSLAALLFLKEGA